jgi:hypothetical protein
VSTIDETKAWARANVCPTWCVADHADDTGGEHNHMSKRTTVSGTDGEPISVRLLGRTSDDGQIDGPLIDVDGVHLSLDAAAVYVSELSHLCLLAYGKRAPSLPSQRVTPTRR